MSKHKYIENPETLLNLWNEYKSFIDSNPDIQEVATARGVVELNIKKPYLRQGFESYAYNKLGHHISQYIDNQENAYTEFLGVITHIRKEWENDQISGSLTGRYKAPNLVARLNGLTEKQEIKHDITSFEFGND